MAKTYGTRSVRLLGALVGASALVAASNIAEAYGRGGSPDYVVAHSRWGHGSVSGPVRYTDRGRQVRLPRGTWVYCVRSCSETLRRETVDFWESNGAQARDSGPGYFRWDFYLPR
jgi:hypothetical protein